MRYKELACMHKRFRCPYLLLNSGTCNFSWTTPTMEQYGPRKRPSYTNL